MRRIALVNQKTGEDIEFDFPEFVHEVKLRQFIDYSKALEARERWLSEQDEASFNNPIFLAGFIQQTAKVISEFCGTPLLDTDLPIGDFVTYLNELLGNDKKAIEPLALTRDSLLTLLVNCTMLFESYQPSLRSVDDCTFTYKNTEWQIPKHYRDTLTGDIKYDGLTTAQLTETLEVYRHYERLKKEDVNGSYRLTSLLKVIALIAQKKNEADPFPETDRAVNDRVMKRAYYFQDIDMQTALDIEYFFLSTMIVSNRMPTTIGFLNRLKLKQVAPKKSKRSKRRRRKIGRRSRG